MNIYTCYLGYLFVNFIFKYRYWKINLYYEQRFCSAECTGVLLIKTVQCHFCDHACYIEIFVNIQDVSYFWHQASALVVISCVLVPYMCEDNCTWLDALDLVKWVLMYYKMKLSSTPYCELCCNGNCKMLSLCRTTLNDFEFDMIVFV